jgi:hypothetical protein
MAYVGPETDRETHALLEDQVMPYFQFSPDYAISNVKGYDAIWTKHLLLVDSHNNPLARARRLMKEKLYVTNCDIFDRLSTAAIMIGFILSMVILYYSNGIDVVQEYKFSDDKQTEYANDNERLLSLKNETICATKGSDATKAAQIRQIQSAIGYINSGNYKLDLSQPNVEQLSSLLQSRDKIINLSDPDMIAQLQPVQQAIDAITDVIILDKSQPNADAFASLFGQMKGYINTTDANRTDYLVKVQSLIDAVQTKIDGNKSKFDQLNELNNRWTGRTYVTSRQILAGIAGGVTGWALFKRTSVHRAGFGKKRDGWKAVRNMAQHVNSVKDLLANPGQTTERILTSAKNLGTGLTVGTKKLFTPQVAPHGNRVAVSNAQYEPQPTSTTIFSNRDSAY